MPFSVRMTMLAGLAALVFLGNINQGSPKVAHVARGDHKAGHATNGAHKAGHATKGVRKAGHATKGAHEVEHAPKGAGNAENPTKGSPETPGEAPTSHGPCASEIPEQTGVVTLKEPMIISSSFDCHNQLYVAKGSHVFTLTNSASLSNCIFAQTGMDDTVHVEGHGSFTIQNAFFRSAGDDLITVRDNADVTFTGGVVLSAWNKVVQHDGTGKVTITKGCFQHVHILAKSCGNCDFNDQVAGRTLEVTDSRIYELKTVCGVNFNKEDVCTISGLTGTPEESMCTGYNATTDPKHWPPQLTKNQKNTHCLF